MKSSAEPLATSRRNFCTWPRRSSVPQLGFGAIVMVVGWLVGVVVVVEVVGHSLVLFCSIVHDPHK